MSREAHERARLLGHPAGWIASVAGVGLSPWAPGTAGSLVALGPGVLGGWRHFVGGGAR